MFKALYSYKIKENQWSRVEVTVYDVTYDKHGYPLFLIYFFGQWVRRSAKFFSPIEG